MQPCNEIAELELFKADTIVLGLCYGSSECVVTWSFHFDWLLSTLVENYLKLCQRWRINQFDDGEWTIRSIATFVAAVRIPHTMYLFKVIKHNGIQYGYYNIICFTWHQNNLLLLLFPKNVLLLRIESSGFFNKSIPMKDICVRCKKNRTFQLKFKLAIHSVMSRNTVV